MSTYDKVLYRVIAKHLHMHADMQVLKRRHYSIVNHLQEVIASAPSSTGNCALVLGDSTENAELGIEVFADIHD